MTHSVFISYSHRDRDQCVLLCEGLKKNGIDVHVDDVSIDPGSSLRDSIRDLIKASDVTICLVSANSLQSLWVIWEICQASPDGKFLPAYLDKEFLRDQFVGEVQRRVDDRLEALNTEMTERLNKHWSVEDLSRVHLSLNSLRSDLPSVVRTLREISSIDLTQSNFERGFGQIYKFITGGAQPATSITMAGDLNNTSYAHRRREIEDYIATNELEEAAKRTMDLLREFFGKDKDAVRRATRLSGQIRQLSEAYERESKKPGQTQIELLKWYNETVFSYADNLLGLIPADLLHAA